MTARARQPRSEPREMILIEHLPFETDAGIGERARIGLIVLASDFTIEHEWRAIFAALPGVALFQSRLFNDPIITPELLRAMEPLIAPGGRVSFCPATPSTPSPSAAPPPRWRSARRGCSRKIRAGGQEAPATTPITAAFAAFTRPWGEAHCRAHALSGRGQPDRRRLHHGARLRGAGVRLVQRGE